MCVNLNRVSMAMPLTVLSLSFSVCFFNSDIDGEGKDTVMMPIDDRKLKCSSTTKLKSTRV